MNAPDKHLEQRARALYRQAARQLPPATAARLRSARLAALDTATRESWLSRLLLPAGAFAAIALAALMLSSPLQEPAGSAAPAAMLVPIAEVDGELPPDGAKVDPTLYQNMDFYGWLAQNDDSQASR